MSRTYRLVNSIETAKRIEKKEYNRLLKVYSSYLFATYKDIENWAREEAYTRHRDGNNNLSNCPASFRKYLNREFRAKNKALLRQGKEDFIPFVKNAAWLWW